MQPWQWQGWIAWFCSGESKPRRPGWIEWLRSNQNPYSRKLRIFWLLEHFFPLVLQGLRLPARQKICQSICLGCVSNGLLLGWTGQIFLQKNWNDCRLSQNFVSAFLGFLDVQSVQPVWQILLKLLPNFGIERMQYYSIFSLYQINLPSFHNLLKNLDKNEFFCGEWISY